MRNSLFPQIKTSDIGCQFSDIKIVFQLTAIIISLTLDKFSP